jgi:hypothetical protein
VTGIRDLKHLSERVKKHVASAAHIENVVKFNFFGSVNILSQLNEGYRVSIQRHSELVDKNRHILGRIINCTKFCGTHELSPSADMMKVKYLTIVKHSWT